MRSTHRDASPIAHDFRCVSETDKWQICHRGATEAQIAPGVLGVSGPSGSKSAQGAQGLKGATGAQGAQGAQGIKFAKGAQGVQGAQCIKGARSDTGAQGQALINIFRAHETVVHFVLRHLPAKQKYHIHSIR